jgi:hypothetical protein
MAKKKTNKQNRYEVITQEDTESGDLMIPLPLPLLESLGWKEGDTVEFLIDEQGRYILKKNG